MLTITQAKLAKIPIRKPSTILRLIGFLTYYLAIMSLERP